MTNAMPVPSSPVDRSYPPVPIYGPGFAGDPHTACAEMHARYGPLVFVEVAPGLEAVLVLDYDIARQGLLDADHFLADPRHWQSSAPAGCPVLPMLGWRPDAARSDGAEHARYRRAVTDSLKHLDQFALRRDVEHRAESLIGTFCGLGSADLLFDYAIPLTRDTIDTMLGLAPEPAQQAATAAQALYDSADPYTAHGLLFEAMAETVRMKQAARSPATDVTGWLIDHPAELSVQEAAAALAMVYTFGTDLTWNLIANTLLLVMTDPAFGGELLAGTLTGREAIDRALFVEPPCGHGCPRSTTQLQIIEQVLLPPGHLILFGLAACNRSLSGERAGNRSHLAWGIGPHACPAQTEAQLIAETALERLLDALPDIRLALPAEQLPWRPTQLRRALAGLPVSFPASPPLHPV